MHRDRWLILFQTFLVLFSTAAICSSASSSTSKPRFSVVDHWITDQFGRVRLFHGFNSVEKGHPYYDEQIFNVTRLKLYQQWGFNVVRLGTMWTGAQPVRQGQFNDTYISVLERAVKLLSAYGIHVLLDMHQVSYLLYTCTLFIHWL